MILSAHQLEMFPSLPFWNKCFSSDKFIVLDDVQVNGLHNKYQIMTPNGELWMTVPCKRDFPLFIHEAEIDNSKNWQKSQWKTIENVYGKTPYFNNWEDIFKNFYHDKYTKLEEMTKKAFSTLLLHLKLEAHFKTRFHYSSEHGIKTDPNDKLIFLCKYYDCDTYLSGTGAKGYLNEKKFKDAGIKVIYQDYWIDFMPRLSIMDYLFRKGKRETVKLMDVKYWG